MATISPIFREIPSILTETNSVGSPIASPSKVLAVLRKTAIMYGVKSPRLVAASKRQSVEKVKLAYQQGVRHFGENYVQELHSKAIHLQKHGYGDVKWHFIGHIQSNKAKLLMNVPGLWMVETVSRLKIARVLNRHWGLREKSQQPLKVLIQINSGGDENKAGCSTEECLDLAQYIHRDCEHLEFSGLMTVGRPNHHPERDGPNPDFMAVVKQCKLLQDALQLERLLELSMGMSADFEHAIKLGSTNIRIGTALFGPRDQ